MASKNDLSKARKEIDKIDSDILKLINKRGSLAVEVSKHKKANSLRIYDPAREREIIEKITKNNKGPLSDTDIVSIFQEVITACRSLQLNTTVAYLGPEGSFSNQAAYNKFGGSTELIPVSRFEEVFEEVHKRSVQFGILPVENSIDGSVGSVLDMLSEWDLKITAEYYERISHFLVSKSGKIEDIKTVASHPQALGQCRNTISKSFSKNVELLETASTAGAAKLASESNSVAAISSELAISIYGLKVIKSHMEDSRQNTTRFIVIGKEESPATVNDKTSIVFSIKDEPGALQNALFQPFSKAGINLTKIESRPSKDRPWEYLFFADFSGHYKDKKISKILKEVRSNCVFLKVLGSYPVVNPV